MSFLESGKMKQTATLALIVLLGGFLLYSLSSFISSFLGAIIFYVICNPVMHYLAVKKKMKRGLSAMLVIVLSFLVIIIPLFSISYLLVSKISVIFIDSNTFYFKIQQMNEYIRLNYDFNILSSANLVKLQEGITKIIPNVLGQTVTVIADVGVMYFILFYLLFNGDKIEKNGYNLLPYSKENANLFAKELVSQTYSNVIGAPLLATIQGVFATIGFLLFSVNEPLFWGMMCGFLSFIPFVGSALVWLPAGIYQLYLGANWQGIAILIYGIVVISNIDSVFRFMIQKRFADVHPLITVFGVIIGFNWFGLPGLIFGPLLMSYLIIMIKIYKNEYMS